MADATPHIDILNYSVDAVDGEGHLRVLVDGEYVRYITVDAGLYNVENVLTPLPTPCFAWAKYDELPYIKQRWYPAEIYYLSLTLGEKPRPNVCEVTSGSFPSPAIARSATCVWEIEAYDHETQVYTWLVGHDVGPKFLGYVKEEERTIGLLIKKVEGRHATPEDIPHCRAELSKLYALNITHGDVNKHNLLVSDSRVIIVDFECARRSNDEEVMAEELKQLEQQLFEHFPERQQVYHSSLDPKDIDTIHERERGCSEGWLSQTRTGRNTITSEENKAVLRK